MRAAGAWGEGGAEVVAATRRAAARVAATAVAREAADWAAATVTTARVAAARAAAAGVEVGAELVMEAAAARGRWQGWLRRRRGWTGMRRG